ncbi:hypothetical protein KSS87_006277 [Heliosperma pusillum]|nr:hypothetical protein KSS87_019854 [Heliosperma pusillum]KAH9612067.1 hypothetical protein KSS87_006277 [Heliosperma pusillum]
MGLISNGCIYNLHGGGSRINLAPLIYMPCLAVHFSNPNRLVHCSGWSQPLIVFHRRHLGFSKLKISASGQSGGTYLVQELSRPWLKVPRCLVELSATSLLFVALGILTLSSTNKGCTALAAVGAGSRPVQEESDEEDQVIQKEKNVEDEQLHQEFENWKSKTYALTVPLRVVAVQGSVPPAWIKDFIQSQGKRLKLSVQFRGSIEDIFSELIGSLRKVDVSPKSVLTADLITIGDSWLDLAIAKSVIEPMQMAEDYDWFKGLPEKWKSSGVDLFGWIPYLNNEGKVDPDGRTWAVPYRWGSMVIAYKKSKFDKLGLAPIEDWKDLWRPELSGRIAMVDSPREIIGVVLKYMGGSYNTNDISQDIPGGIRAVQQHLAMLAKQVLLFDSANYLKAFSVGDAWVAVGWSSDILPAAKRLSNVAVVVPKSGASLWADLWAVPDTTRFPPSENLGGRIRGPSPLIYQWLDFCLQPARDLPFKQGVFPGASPTALEKLPSDPSKLLPKGAPKLVTNLVAGMPPPEILAKCEFLEPLSETALSEYRLLISTMEKPGHGHLRQFLFTTFQDTWSKFLSLRKEIGEYAFPVRKM